MTNLMVLGRGPILAEVLAAYARDETLRLRLPIKVFVGEPTMAALVEAASPGQAGSLLHIASDTRQPEEILSAIQSQDVHLVLSIQYSWILPEVVISAVDGNAFNLHNARLPDYRGHHALSHEILNGDTTHAISLHWMQPKVDTGFMALSQEIPIAGDETALSLGRKATTAASALVLEFLNIVAEGGPIPKRPIPEGGRFYSMHDLEKVKKLDPSDPAVMARAVRACFHPPYEPAYLEIEGRRFHVTPGWQFSD